MCQDELHITMDGHHGYSDDLTVPLPPLIRPALTDPPSAGTIVPRQDQNLPQQYICAGL